MLNIITSSECYLISSCKIVKDFWDTLCDTYEGIDTIKEIKINALLQKYELFKFKLNETIKAAFNRFTTIFDHRLIGSTRISWARTQPVGLF